MGDDPTHPEIPTDVQTMLALLNQLSGNVGTSARLDWSEQTLSVVGQLTRDPNALDPDDSDCMLDLFDSQIYPVIIDEYDLDVLDRHVGDGGFRYEFDVSQYIDERPFILSIPFDDELHGNPPEHYQEYLDRKSDEE